jgi:hypothetical protein
MPSAHELMKTLESTRNRLRNIREEGQAIAKRSINMGIGAATGAGLGLLDFHYGKVNAMGIKKAKVPGTDIDADVGMALLASAVGVTGIAGTMTDEVVAVGIGAGACAARDWAYIGAMRSETAAKK